MRTDWKRSMTVLLGAGVIALTAACGTEVSGAAQGGVPAVAGSESSPEVASTGESSAEVTTSGSEQEPAPSVADPSPSPDPTTETGEEGGNNSVPNPSPSEAEPTATPTSESPSSASSGSSEDYAFTEDYCTLMPKASVTGLEKDATRDKTLTCTYKTPDSAKNLRIVTVSGGFDLSYENLDESYNVDLERVKIDGREGFTWHNSTDSLYSALFNLPAPEGRKMSIMVIITDDGKSLAEKKKEAVEIAAVISKEVPR